MIVTIWGSERTTVSNVPLLSIPGIGDIGTAVSTAVGAAGQAQTAVGQVQAIADQLGDLSGAIAATDAARQQAQTAAQAATTAAGTVAGMQDDIEGAVAVATSASRAAGLTPMDFGAVGDGVTDDTAAIAEAASAGIAINGAGKTYRVTSTIILPKTRHRWRDMSIDGTGIPTAGDFTTPVVSLSGDLPSVIGTATADVLQGSDTIQLSGTAGLAAGNWVLLRSDKKMAETEVSGQTTRHSRACELLRVRSVAGLEVKFFSLTQDAYLLADNPRLEKVQTAAGVDFENVTFIGADVGLYVSEGFESRYRNVRAFNQTAYGVNEDRCYRSVGDDFYFESQATDPGFTQAPYGLAYTGCQDCKYGDVSGLRTRHLTTTGSAVTTKGRNVSRGCVLGNIHAIDCFSTPVDQHPGGGFIQVGHVYATFSHNATQRLAVQFEGAGGSVASINAPMAGGFYFNCFGFFQEEFTPYAFIGSLLAGGADTGVNVVNYSNRYGTGQAQTIRFDIASMQGNYGTGIRAAPINGGIVGGVASGSIRALPSLGLGRCFHALAVNGNVAHFRNGPIECEAPSGSRIIQMDGGTISFSGGRLAGMGGNAELRLTDATLRLIGTDEANLAQVLTSSQVLRATLA